MGNVKYCRRSTQLHVGIRNPISYHLYNPPCPKTCSSSPLHITFVSLSTNLYFDSTNLQSLIGEHKEVTGENTICTDGSLFFDGHHLRKSYILVSEVLDSLNIKKYLRVKIFRQLMKFGQRRNKSKMFKDLLVNMTFVRKFDGDRVSVHEVIEKSWKDRETQLREDGVKYSNVTLI